MDSAIKKEREGILMCEWLKNFNFECFFKVLFGAICFDIFREIILDLL